MGVFYGHGKNKSKRKINTTNKITAEGEKSKELTEGSKYKNGNVCALRSACVNGLLFGW